MDLPRLLRTARERHDEETAGDAGDERPPVHHSST
jgi:hypothetical protein